MSESTKESKKRTDELDDTDCEEKSNTKLDTHFKEKSTEESVDTQPKGNNITESAKQTGKCTKESENIEPDDTQSDDDNESLQELCKDLRYRRRNRVVKNKELKIILAAKRKSEMDNTNDDSEKK